MLKGPLHRLTQSLVLHRLSVRPPWRQYTDDSLKHALASSKVLQFGKRAVKYTLFTSLGLVATTVLGFEAAHLWVEKVELAPEEDTEVKRWEWDQDREKWTGDIVLGGTDPALGTNGRHRVRAAWASYNWGGETAIAVLGSGATHGDHASSGILELVDVNMKKTESFLHGALRIAHERNARAQLHPETIINLTTRHASVLERMGGDALQKSKIEFENAWIGLSGQGLGAASIAVRLGEISSRLGQTNDAMLWWLRAVKLTRGETPDNLETLPEVLVPAPSSPRAQRILATTLVSLSALYAKCGKLDQARALEEATLAMLRTVPPPTTSFTSTSPPYALHALYLLHRSSLISIHLAEVLNAQSQPLTLSIQYLNSAAESAERVARALTGSHISESSAPIPGTTPLSAYTSSRSMKKPAKALLRDARRTSAEAWNLIGILNETQGRNLPAALQCYERAVQWAGTTRDGKSEIMQPGEGILESEWAMIWGNYNRVKRIVEER